MTDPSATVDVPAPTQAEEAPEPLSFELHIISTGSETPLNFPHLPATTTVNELKTKIRDALPSKPESQRLIYRGRLISRDTDTMLDVFGQETLASPEPKNIHLVLPPPPAADPPITAPVPDLPLLNNAIPRAFGATMPPRPQSTPLNLAQGMTAQQQPPGLPHVHQHQIRQTHDGNGVRLQQMQNETQRLYQEIGALEQRMRALLQPTFTHTPPTGPGNDNPVEQLEQRMRALGQSNILNAQQPVGVNVGGAMFGMPQRQAPMAPLPAGLPSFQNLINQHQRERAAQGLHGPRDIPGMPPSISAPGSGRASPVINRPDHTTTYTREGVGPNGERWHVTVNETTTNIPQDGAHPHQHLHGLPNIPHPALQFPMGPAPQVNVPPQVNAHPHGLMHPHQHHVQEMQAILRNADRLNYARQSQGIPPNPPSATVPLSAPNSSIPGGQRSETPVPVASSTTINNPQAATIANNTVAQPRTISLSAQRLGQPTAYILSSPTGPQALLVSSAGVFWTPRPSSRRHSPNHSPVGAQDQAAAAGFPEFRNRPAHRAGRRHAQHENVPEVLNNAPILNPHANPAAAAGGLAQFGPMLWLLVRLAGFVWFFTSGNTSWTRLLIISGLALLLFIANTGVFNGVAEQAWGPVRRHLEALIPLAGPDAALVPAANAAIVAQAERPAGEADHVNPNLRRRRRAPEPTPAEVAARIIAERRQNQGWLTTQIRRVEHAALLFLASLVPGVGERHIAAREAEATAAEAERQRRIDAENAEDAAANAEGGDIGAGNNAGSGTGEPGASATEGAPPERLVNV